MNNTPTIMFTNQKGGVGKTTITRELGMALALRDRKILLIDADPQGNLSKSLLDNPGAGLYEALEGEAAAPIEARTNLWLFSGDARLAALEKRYLGELDAYERLKAVLVAHSGYDLILIDSPPSLGIMTLNGLVAASHFVIPLRPALYSLQGTNDLLTSVAKVRRSLNQELELLGVVLNDYLAGPIIARQIKAEIEESFGERVFTTIISRTVKVEEAIASGRSVVEGEGRIGLEMGQLADEFLARLAGG